MTTPRLSADNTDTRLAELQDREYKIHSAFRRGLEATCTIAYELNAILAEQLYLEAGYDEFAPYVTERLNIKPSSYRRICLASQIVDQIRAAGLALPSNESQVLELADIEPEKRAKVWQNLLAQQDPEVVTTAADVRRAVEHTKSTPPAGTVEIDMDMDNGDEEPQEKQVQGTVVAPMEGLFLTEKGEAALARIRHLCGEAVAQGIETGASRFSERELRTWADQPDHIVKALPHYVVFSTWSVSKAIAFETQPISGATDVDQMLLIAKARGGSAVLNYQNAKIRITLGPD